MFEEIDEPNFNVNEDSENSISFNKNELQTKFNQIKGTITQFGEGEKHCWVIITTGKQRKRNIYISIKKDCFESIIDRFAIDDKVSVNFYVSSFEGTNPPANQTVKKWYTICSLIEMEMLP